MTTADVVEACIDSLQGDVVNEYLQQYADILRQTTEGTDALAKKQEAEEKHLDDPEMWAIQLDHTEQIWGLCRTYEQRLKVVEAEVTRLREAMDKYSEDEMLKGNLHPPASADDGMVRVPRDRGDPMENWLMKPALEWLEEAEHGAEQGRCRLIAGMLRDLWKNNDTMGAFPVAPAAAQEMEMTRRRDG